MTMKNDSILSGRRFLPMFFAQFLGALNDNLYKNALILIITYQSLSLYGLSSSELVSVCSALFIIPYFLFSGHIGAIANYFSKRNIVIIVKLLEVFIMLMAITGFYLHNFTVLIIALFLLGTHSAIFGPIKFSVLPELVSNKKLVQANSLFGMGTFVAILMGSISGGVLVKFYPENLPIIGYTGLVVATLGLLSALVLIKIPPMDLSNRPPQSWNFFASTIKTIKISLIDKHIFKHILRISWFFFLGSAFLVVIPLYTKDFLYADEMVASLFLAIFSIGIATGSGICGILSKLTTEKRIITIGALGLFACNLSIFLIELIFPSAHVFVLKEVSQFFSEPKGIAIAAIFFTMAMCGGIFVIPCQTYLQKYSTDEMRTQNIAANNIINAIYMSLSSLLLFILFRFQLSVPLIILILALMNGFVFLECFFYEKKYQNTTRQ